MILDSIIPSYSYDISDTRPTIILLLLIFIYYQSIKHYSEYYCFYYMDYTTSTGNNTVS